MKKLSFSLLAVFAILIGIIACNKTSELKPLESKAKRMTVAEAAKLGIYDDSSQDIEEQVPQEEKTPLEIHERGATHSISAILGEYVFAKNEFPCSKDFTGYQAIQAYTTQTIKGKGFGATKASTTTVTLNMNKINIPFAINSWSDTLIELYVDDNFDQTKFTYGDLTATITVAGNAVSKKAKFFSGMDGAGEYGWRKLMFPSAGWEIVLQRAGIEAQRQYPSRWGNSFEIPANYVPKVGDILARAENEHTSQAGVVKQVTSKGSGLYEVLVYERNLKCTGALQKKKYKYLFGLFIPKTGEGFFNWVAPIDNEY